MYNVVICIMVQVLSLLAVAVVYSHCSSCINWEPGGMPGDVNWSTCMKTYRSVNAAILGNSYLVFALMHRCFNYSRCQQIMSCVKDSV